MIAKLTGAVRKLSAPHLTVEVAGVGYLVSCPLPLWEEMREGTEVDLAIYTLVREDRLELFGFSSWQDREFFAALLQCSGIGPKTALQIASIPYDTLLHAVGQQDVRPLTSVRGVGPKLAEKILLELSGLTKRGLLPLVEGERHDRPSAIDRDALDALVALGYDVTHVLPLLSSLPTHITTTEERVTEVLRATACSPSTPRAHSRK